MLYMVTFTINIPPMLVYIPYMDPMGHDKSKENVKMNICRIIVEFHISRKLHALRSQNIQKSAQSHVPDQSCRPGQPPDGRNAAGIWIVGTMGCPSFHPRGSSAVQQTGWCPWSILWARPNQKIKVNQELKDVERHIKTQNTTWL